MLVFQEVRLEMNSLRVKKDDKIRRSLNELASEVPSRLLLLGRGLRLETQKWSQGVIRDGRSLNHS